MAKINWGDVGAFGAGALDELLLGAPEWLLKNLGARKAVEEYKQKYEPAYKAGEIAGTVGGAFVPFGAIGKGLKAGAAGAKALKAADVGTDIVRAADTATDIAKAAKIAEGAKIAETAADLGAAAKKSSLARELLSAAGKGAKWGGAEAAARGFFGEETPEEVMRNVQQGILFGGLGGAGGTALGKAAPYLSKLGKKATEKATLGLTDARTRDLLATAQRLSGEGSGPMAQVRKVDDIRRELSDIIKRRGLYKEGAIEKAAADVSKSFEKFDEAYELVAGGAKGKEVLQGLLTPDDLAEISSKYDPETIQAAMAKVMKPVENRTGLANIRDKLEQVAKQARSGKEESAEVSDAMFDMAKKFRRNLDENVLKVAEASGINIPPNFKREYGLLMPFAKGEVKSELTGTKFGLGSPTFEKMAAATLFGGGSSILGGKDEPIQDKAVRAALGAAAGFAGGKALSAALRRGVASADTLAGLAEKAAPKIGEALTVPAARAAANIANVAAESAEPTTPDEAEAAQSGAEIGAATDTKQYSSLILSRLRAFAEAEGISPDSPDFAEFVQYVGQSTTGDSGPFDPEKLAPVLYPDPEQRAKFTKALSISRQLSQTLPGAMKAAPLLGIGESTEESIARQSALDQLSSLVGEVAKERGTEKAAKNQLNQILKSRMPQRDKERLIRGILENYGIDFETLSQVGLA